MALSFTHGRSIGATLLLRGVDCSDSSYASPRSRSDDLHLFSYVENGADRILFRIAVLANPKNRKEATVDGLKHKNG
jgi:hypothetical protein